MTLGGLVEVRGQTGTAFPASDAAVGVERVADARLVSAMGSEALTDLSHVGTSLMIRHKPTVAGERIVAVSLKPAQIREAAGAFRRYLQLEGAAEAVERLDREGKIGADSIIRRTTKHAKTFIEIGQGGPRAFALSSGQAAELVPARDPSALRAGDILVVRLMDRGKAVVGATLRAGIAPTGISKGSTGREVVAARAGETDVAIVTDAEGAARLPITRAGLWNVRGVSVAPGESGSGVTWDVHWVTMVFQVGYAAALPGGRADAATARAAAASPGDIASRSAPSDTDAVAAVVRRFHESLAAGDSGTALSVLSGDVLIIEAGDIQTRDQYRSHHLAADIAFARAVPSSHGPSSIVVRGDAAWVSSTSVSEGTYNGRAVKSAGAELVVLSRETNGWMIRAIHWSSRARRAAAAP
ncbi:MAG: DUF4198 domain-containing protein [Gemmatimonadota bacterium]|nr:DUF4198 domain-containing protein [Gemmatimonadota bacterium]